MEERISAVDEWYSELEIIDFEWGGTENEEGVEEESEKDAVTRIMEEVSSLEPSI